MGAKEAPYSITLNRQLHSHGVTNTQEKEEKNHVKTRLELHGLCLNQFHFRTFSCAVDRNNTNMFSIICSTFSLSILNISTIKKRKERIGCITLNQNKHRPWNSRAGLGSTGNSVQLPTPSNRTNTIENRY